MSRQQSRERGAPTWRLVVTLLLLALSYAWRAEATTVCLNSDGWTIIGDREFLLVDKPLPQPAAEAYCTGLGGQSHLASIHDKDTDTEVHQMVIDQIGRSTVNLVPDGSGGAAWLGLVLTRTDPPKWMDSSKNDYNGTWSVNGKDPNLLNNPAYKRACVHLGRLMFNGDPRVYLENGSWGDDDCAKAWWPMCARPKTAGNCTTAATPAVPSPAAPSPSPASGKKSSGKKGLGMGVIVGAAAGGVAALVAAAVLVFVLWKVHRRVKADKQLDDLDTALGGVKGKDVEAARGPGGGVSGRGPQAAANAPSAAGNRIPAAAMGSTEVPPSTQMVAPAVVTSAQSPLGANSLPDQGSSGRSAADASGSNVGVAGVPAARMMVLPGAPPMSHGGGAAGDGPGGMDLMNLGMAFPAITTCLIVAREIIDMGDRVVGNQVRCKRLTRRIARLVPQLERLEGAVNSKEVGDREVEPYVTEMHDVCGRTRTIVQQWGAKLEGPLGLLRGMLSSRAYEQELVDLNERLDSLMNDLGTLLQVRQGFGSLYAGKREQAHEEVEKEVEADMVKDLQQLAVQVAADPKMLEGLSAQERSALEATYKEHKLDLKDMTEMLRMQARQQYLESRMGDFLIQWGSIQLGNKIGAGGFGEVHLARWDGRKVAVKVLQVGECTGRLERDMKREAYIMSQLHHHNVARFYGLVLQPEACALVMAFYPRGTLTARLQDEQPLDWPTRIGYALDVAKGMAYLHSRPYEPVVHGDLKPSNLLLHTDDSGDDCVVITDFGLSRVQTLTASVTRTGNHNSALSAAYAAPELISDPSKRKTLASDVYAFGMLMYEIAAREPPFSQQRDSFLVMHHVKEGKRPPVPEETPEGYAELMKACWAQQPAARPAFDEVVRALISLQGM